MTNEQKLQIKHLRESGLDYSAIAGSLSLTKAQVSSYCYRNDLGSGKKAGTNMTNEQKLQIKHLRESGFGYTAIAESLSLTKFQVSSYCYRNDLGGKKTGTHSTERPDIDYCRCCGKVLTQVPKQKRFKFCSKECRVKWWNSHPEKVHRRAFYNFTCAHCGKEFTAYGNANRKFCSHSCYIAERFKGGNDCE